MIFVENLDLKIFSERLKKAREDRGWSQLELSFEARISQGAVSEYENGTRSPTGDKLKKLAQALYVTTDYLLGIDSDPDAPEPIQEPPNPVMDEVLDDTGFWKRQGIYPPSEEEKEFIKTNYRFRDDSGGNLDRLASFYRETLPYILGRVRNSGFLEEK